MSLLKIILIYYLYRKFLIKGFQPPLRLDRSGTGGGVLFYVREKITFKEKHPYVSEFPDLECIFLEINIKKKLWLLVGTYNPCNSTIKQHLEKLSLYIDTLCTIYGNIVVIGDFNSEPTESKLMEFCNLHNFTNLIHEPTCFKNIVNPRCIDLILT